MQYRPRNAAHTSNLGVPRRIAMPDIFVRCPFMGCRQVLSVSDQSRGLLVTCSFCKRALRIPQARRDAATAGAMGSAAPPATARPAQRPPRAA